MMSIFLIVVLVVIALSFVLRMPIAFGMIVSGIIYFLLKNQDISLVAELILTKLFSSYILIAVPLFIFTANIMNSGEITEKVFRFANVLVGRWKGGLGHVNVVASLIFSGMTGSAVADASGLGIMEIEAMRKQNYEDGFGAAITACSATIGPIFPPSIPLVLYSMLAGVSIGNLFLGGMIPGVLIAFALMGYIAVIAKRRNYPKGERYGKAQLLRFSFTALPALLTPVILLVGIYSGIMTPTEAGAVAALYALIVSLLIYRSLGFRSLAKILLDTIRATGAIGITVGAALLFSFIIANEKFAGIVGVFILSFTSNKIVFLLLINVVLLFLGMFLDSAALQLVLIPLLAPIAERMGVDLVHFGLIFTLNTMIGLSTPPFGMLLFIVAGISKVPMRDIIKEVLPMLGVMVGVLLLITYVPRIVLFLPEMFGY